MLLLWRQTRASKLVTRHLQSRLVDRTHVFLPTAQSRGQQHDSEFARGKKSGRALAAEGSVKQAFESGSPFCGQLANPRQLPNELCHKLIPGTNDDRHPIAAYG